MARQAPAPTQPAVRGTQGTREPTERKHFNNTVRSDRMVCADPQLADIGSNPISSIYASEDGTKRPPMEVSLTWFNSTGWHWL